MSTPALRAAQLADLQVAYPDPDAVLPVAHLQAFRALEAAVAADLAAAAVPPAP